MHEKYFSITPKNATRNVLSILPCPRGIWGFDEKGALEIQGQIEEFKRICERIKK